MECMITNEPIDVIAVFGVDAKRHPASAGKENKLRPVKFRWSNREYKIKDVNGRWMRSEGRFPIYCFSVSCDSGDVFEIEFCAQFMQWRVVKVYLC